MKPITFKKQLKEVREFLGLTQSELAMRAKLTPAAISQLEAGEREPQLGTLVRLADALGVSIDRLVRGNS